MSFSSLYQQLNKSERRWLLYICLAFLSLGLIWITFSNHGVLRYFQLKEETRLVKEENMKLQEENQRNRQEIDNLKNDPAFLEEIARKEFGLIKKNEIVFTFK